MHSKQIQDFFLKMVLRSKLVSSSKPLVDTKKTLERYKNSQVYKLYEQQSQKRHKSAVSFKKKSQHVYSNNHKGNLTVHEYTLKVKSQKKRNLSN